MRFYYSEENTCTLDGVTIPQIVRSTETDTSSTRKVYS